MSAYVPDLPGCITTGRTVEEIEQNIREAIEGLWHWRLKFHLRREGAEKRFHGEFRAFSVPSVPLW